jgi:hypothetical protein
MSPYVQVTPILAVPVTVLGLVALLRAKPDDIPRSYCGWARGSAGSGNPEPAGAPLLRCAVNVCWVRSVAVNSCRKRFLHARHIHAAAPGEIACPVAPVHLYGARVRQGGAEFEFWSLASGGAGLRW